MKIALAGAGDCPGSFELQKPAVLVQFGRGVLQCREALGSVVQEGCVG